MGGLELLIAMILAGTITHAVENSGRQAKARWDQSREDARRSAEARQESRRQRADQVRDRFGRAQSTGPRDPLWWPYAAGWAAAGTAAAAGAGVVGLVKGAKAGARSGYRVGKQGADRGWNLRDTWTQWRTENPREPLDLEECERCGGWAAELHATMDHGLVCDDCLPADTTDRDEPAPEPDERLRGRQMRCHICANLTDIDQLDEDRCCPTCGNWDRSGVGGHCDGNCTSADVDPSDAERQGLCWHCGGRREIVHDFGGEHRHVPCRICYGTGRRGADNDHEPPGAVTPPLAGATADQLELVQAEATRLDSREKENPEMNALPGSSVAAVTGEGYTDTIQSLQALAKEMQDAQNAATDLGDSLTANSLDPDTLQQIADLTDQVETVANLAEQLHRHVEQRHNPLAEATAAAGGSGNVASKTWYDQY